MSDTLDKLKEMRDESCTRDDFDTLAEAIAEIAQLRAGDPLYPCESCGNMTVSAIGEEIVCFTCHSASIRRAALLDAAKMVMSLRHHGDTLREYMDRLLKELRRAAEETAPSSAPP